MYKSKEFEEFLKSELYNEAGKIDPSEDVLYRALSEIGKNENADKPLLKEIILNKALPVRLNIKRCFTAVLCTIFVVIGLTFTFSEEARVAAADGINNLSRWIYVVDRTDEGYTPIKVQLDDSSTPDTTFEHTEMTDQELQKEAGFFIKIPSELSGGYKFNNKGRLFRNCDNSTVVVSAEYINHNELLSIEIRDIEYLEQLKNDKKISKMVNKKVLKVGNHEVYWIEDSVTGIYQDHDLQQKPTGVKILHGMLWEYKDTCYYLRGNEQDKDLSLDDALKIAEGILNDVYPSADTIQEEKETDTYETIEKSRSEIEKKLGYSAKIPKVLQGNFRLIEQEVGNDSYTNDSKMYVGSYAQESKEIYIRRVQLIITQSDWPLQEYNRIKEPGDDTKAFKADGQEYLWRWNKSMSHQLGWKDNGVYYRISMEKGDFSSLEEALTIAKAIIKDTPPKP